MKKKLSLLMVAFFSIVAFAATLTWKAPDTASEVTLDFTAQNYDNGQAVESLTEADVTASFAKGSNSNAPKYYTAGTAVRCYGGNTFALSSEKTITKAVFTFGSSDGTNEITADKGTFETDTWTGSENAVTFTIGGTTGNRRIQKIVVTLSGEAPAVAKPVITGETPFLGTTDVTITCATEGAAIYYTTDGTAPTAESTAYTEPFAINATTTVKAIAVKDADQSEVAEKTFTAMEGTATLAELNALENNATFGFTGEALVVAKPTAKYVYVTDASGAALIYDASGEKTTAAEVGKTIAANWTGKVSIYNQLTELIPDAALVMKDGDAVAVEYPEVAAADMIAENVNKVVTLKGITGYAVDGKNITITIGETPVAGYNQFGLEIAAAEEGKTYEMVGAIGRYNDNIQFQPISIARTPEVVDVTVDAADITGDITAALNAKTTPITEAGDIVGNITINLEAGAYTVSAPIVAGGNVVINGNGATIDASALAGNFIEMTSRAEKDSWKAIENISIQNATIKGLKKALFYSAYKQYDINLLAIDNCVIELAADAITLDFTKGSVARNVTIENSTVYAPTATTKSFFSSQSAQRLTDITGVDSNVDKQTFTFKNSTLYNLAPGKNFFTHRQNSQKWLKFVAKNNIFVDCGKSGQTIKGMNGGGSSANPQFDIDGNVFNYGGADTGATEDTGDADEPVQNTIAGVVTFTNAVTGDFNATLGTEDAPATATTAVGDPRWTVTNKQIPANITIGATELEAAANDISAALATAATGKIVGNLTVNLTAGGAYKVTAPIEAGGSVVINGAAGATIDASALTAPFIALSAEPTAPFLPKNDGTGDTDYYGIDKVDINNVKVTGLKQSIFWDSNKKYCVVDFKIDNCVFALATEAVQNDALIAFQAGGAKDFTVKNSTIYGNNAVAKYFVRYNNSARIDRYGFVQAEDTWSFTYENNTFYGLLNSDGQWGNYSGITGKQPQGIITVNNNIWVDCDANTMRRMLNSKNFDSGFHANSAMANNVFNREGAVVDQGNYSNGSDLKGVVTFTDAANGDFNGKIKLAPGTVAPATLPGDARWTLTTEATKLYVIGSMNGWNRTAMTEMTFNAEKQVFEYEYAPTTTAYLAFADYQMTEDEATADADWAIFNTYRYATGAGDQPATLNSPVALQKGIEGTIVLQPVKSGTSYTITVAADFSTVTIAGEAKPILPYVVAGSSAELFGTTWDAVAEANAMTLNATTGNYEITYSNVTLSAGNIEYKVVKDGSTWLPESGNLVLNISEAGSYNVTFTINPNTNEITGVATSTTGINAVKADALKDAQIYTISGQRVDKAQKGLYIVNGRKVVVK